VTRQYFVEAGLAPGLRVLDVGSGAGDVAFLVAELVGPEGDVVGTDVAAAAVDAASREAEARGLRWVRFELGDPAEMEFEGLFDAVVGRYFLPFQADPSRTLRRLSRHVRRGGIIAFHEPDWTAVRSVPPVPLYEGACNWIAETTRMSGTPWNFADRVHAVFVDAGLSTPHMRMQTLLVGAEHAGPWISALADIVETLAPTIVECGVATDSDIDVATFRERLSADVLSTGGAIFGRTEVGAWVRVP
jgi:SAM-dependent methyltransferase